mgnify:CR=1 FL=1
MVISIAVPCDFTAPYPVVYFLAGQLHYGYGHSASSVILDWPGFSIKFSCILTILELLPVTNTQSQNMIESDSIFMGSNCFCE